MLVLDTDRYVIEPRCDRACHHWLVVFDRVANDYIKDGTGKAFARFENSDTIVGVLGKIPKPTVDTEPEKPKKVVKDIPLDCRTMSFYMQKALENKGGKVLWVTTVIGSSEGGLKIAATNKVMLKKPGDAHYKTYYVKFFNASIADPVMHAYMYLDRITIVEADKYSEVVCEEARIHDQWKMEQEKPEMTNKKFISKIAQSIIDRFCRAIGFTGGKEDGEKVEF